MTSKNEPNTVVDPGRPVLLRRGRFAVVQGPFPRGMVRSLTAKTPEAAMQRREIVARPATASTDYAKVVYQDVAPPNNDWGEVCP